MSKATELELYLLNLPIGSWEEHTKNKEAAALLRQQEAVIKQMHESMCWASRVLQIDVDDAPGYFAAIAAAKEVLK